MIIKNNVSKYRKELNCTQEDLALACGVSRQTINSIESSKSVPNIYLALKIAYVLSVPVQFIFKYPFR